VQAAYITKEMVADFPQFAHWLSPLSEFKNMIAIPEDWHDYVILGSGSHDFLRLLMPKLKHHVGPFIYANEVVFTNQRPRDLMGLYKTWAVHDVLLGLHSVITTHAEFGGVTSARHMISFRGVAQDIFTPKAPLPRTLRHVLSDTAAVAVQEISAPTPLQDPLPRAPIYVDGMMRREGLFNLARPTAHIACPCVFKATGWGRRTISTAESLRAFDISPLMDAVLMPNRRARTLLQRSITPLVVTSICRNLWNTLGGLAGDASTQQNLDKVLASNESGGKLNTETTTMKDTFKGTMTDLGEGKEEKTEQVSADQTLFDTIKKEHDLAKAVKSDDAEIPKHLWDIAVCCGPPTLEQTKALTTIRVFMLRIYCKRLWREIRAYMKHTHGADWTTKRHNAKKNRNTAEEAEGV